MDNPKQKFAEQLYQILGANMEIQSLRKLVLFLKSNGIKVPGKSGLIQPTIKNIQEYLPYQFLNSKSPK